MVFCRISFLASVVSVGTALTQTAYIDDTYGDSITGAMPIYGDSVGPWNVQPGCDTCSLNGVDESEVYDGTWHDNTYIVGSPRMYVNLTFEGTTIAVFNIIPIAAAAGTGFTTYLQFVLDGEPETPLFILPPDALGTASDDGTPIPDYLYKYEVYLKENMTNGTHTLQMTVPTDAPDNAVILFDYALYQFESDDLETGISIPPVVTETATLPNPTGFSSSPPSTTPTNQPQFSSSNHASPIGIITGAAIGFVALLVLIGCGVWFWLRCRRRKTQDMKRTSTGVAAFDPTALVVDPFVDPAEDQMRQTGASRMGGGGPVPLTAPLDYEPEIRAVSPAGMAIAGPSNNGAHPAEVVLPEESASTDVSADTPLTASDAPRRSPSLRSERASQELQEPEHGGTVGDDRAVEEASTDVTAPGEV